MAETYERGDEMNQAGAHLAALRQALDAKVRGLTDKLRRADLSRQDKIIICAQYALSALRLHPRVQVMRHVLFELTEPPRVLRGLRDLVVRPGTPADIPALAAVRAEGDGADEDLLRRRFDRGDLLFVGQIGGNLLCQSWFHRGPRAFEEDGEHLAHWALDAGTFWSYDAAASASARSSGVFVKVFQTALRELFQERGAKRVQCRVRADNTSSLLLHERLGFQRLGTVSSLSTPLLRLVQFHGPAGSTRWLVPGRRSLSLPVPPQPPPPGWGRA